MNIQRALLRNTLWYGIVTAIGLVSGLLMSIILARGLGPALMGELSYLFWFERTMTAMASLGYGVATVRYTADAFARGEDERAWGVVRLYMRWEIVTTAIVVIVMLPVIAYVVPGGLRGLFVVILAQLFVITIESIYSYALQGAQRYDITARTSTIKMALQLAVAAAAIAAGAGLLTLVIGFSLTLLVSCAIQRHRAHQVYRDSLDAPTAAMTPEARAYLIPLSVVTILDAIVWDRSEVFFLGLYASSEAIAYYSLAFGLASRIMIVPGIAVGALLPAFSALHGAGAPEEFSRLYRTALRYVGLAGVPLAAVIAALAPGLVLSLYGEAYRPVAPLIGVLATVSLLAALRAVALAALRGVGDRHCALTATAVAAAVNIGLAALLIPHFTVVGAVIANTAAQVTASVWVFVGIWRTHKIGVPMTDFAKLAGAGVLALAVAWAVVGDAHEPLRMIVAGATGVAAFLLACVVLRLIGAREWGLITTSTRRLAARASGATTA